MHPRMLVGVRVVGSCSVASRTKPFKASAPRAFKYVLMRTFAGKAKTSIDEVLEPAQTDVKVRRPRRKLRTLNPERLSAQEFINLSGKKQPVIRSPTTGLRASPRYTQKGDAFFPADTRGFFYWHIEPGAPALTGQVRFRITVSSDPETFSAGKDLRLPDGDVWALTVFDIARYKSHSLFQDALLSDGLVTEDILDMATGIQSGPVGTSRTVWRFGQTFLVRFEHHKTTIWGVSNSGADKMILDGLFLSRPHRGKPYRGLAFLQFERSTLPEHDGTWTVVLRIVKILNLIKFQVVDNDIPPEPKEGELVMMLPRGPGSGSWKPWCSVLDNNPARPKTKALKSLFEREEDISQGENNSKLRHKFYPPQSSANAG
ncbi:hypothetical protein NEOLEDRAFT_1174423 [Neolentinus lepideus HHB14362 ss-1]|uniref:Uncharacterized protein n=1 Tax=Neolentinus lepideus HHB14362 ss-1 TaxID=1314782 RepID=A0A165VRQ1_9AGAM|nr:hypothetical protein NEOLEDRAFT_1174423 [Neolentinus lepideus HHB14362 ss-1]